ncbi:MAG TPA: hypothetical protein VF184_07525 [Phycisphaeraceae bacterium]
MTWLILPCCAALVLAYRPFLDPLPLHSGWMWLMLPLALAIAVVYKTIKLPDLSALPRQAATLAVQIIVFMALAAAAVWLIVELA